MESFDLEKAILKLISQNKKGVTMDVIIDYLDYVNRVRYEQEEVDPIIDKLIEENKIRKDDQLYYPALPDL